MATSESTSGSGPIQSSSPARVFHLFGNLPVELRLRIWDLNLPGFRIIPIRCGDALDSSPAPSPPLRPSIVHTASTASSSSSSLSPFHSAPISPLPVSPGPPCRCTSSIPVPTNLHVCQESRDDALRRYRLAFGIARQPPRIYFDPTRDVLYFGPRDGYMASEAQFRTVLALARPEDLASVRYLALNDALFWADAAALPQSYHSAVAASLTVEVLRQVRRKLPGLRELFFVPRDGNPVYSGEAALVDTIPGDARHERLANQILTAMDNVTQQFPEWEPPVWSIMSLSAEPGLTTAGSAEMRVGGDDVAEAVPAAATAAGDGDAHHMAEEHSEGGSDPHPATGTADLDEHKRLEIRTSGRGQYDGDLDLGGPSIGERVPGSKRRKMSP